MNDLEASKRNALRNLERVQQSRKLATEQGVSWAKWLTASLLAVNGAGAVAVLNSVEKLHRPDVSGAVFIGGLALALLSGWGLELSYFRQIPFAEDLEFFWERVSDTGVVDEAEKEELERRALIIRRWDWAPPLFGLLSGLVFVAGAIVVALNGVAAK